MTASAWPRRLGLWTMTVLSVGVAVASYRYLIPGAPGAPPTILANRFTHLGALTLHAAFAATALLVGPFQFRSRLRARRPSLHRRLGTLYVVCCVVAGLAGLVLALGSTAGPIASAGFGLLAVFWLFTTADAWRLARARDFVRHQRWMVRSFALCLAAVTLRLYLAIVGVAGLPFMASYVAISFLCWVPNLIVAEVGVRVFLMRRVAAPLGAPSPAAG